MASESWGKMYVVTYRCRSRPKLLERWTVIAEHAGQAVE